MGDARKPHKAVILMTVEVHEVLDTGECSGKPISSDELSKFKIKTKQILEVNGQNKQDCLEKLQRAINEFK